MIIGITGTIGSGKGALVSRLVEKFGFVHFSARDFISQEILRRNLPIDRNTLVEVANDLRSKHSPAFVIEELYKKAVQAGGNAIIESVRTLGEVDFLRKQKLQGNFFLFAVDADPKIRYERVLLRKSATDQISFEKFLADEKREISADDPNKQNLSECIKKADFTFTNNGDFDALNLQIDAVMKKILQ